MEKQALAEVTTSETTTIEAAPAAPAPLVTKGTATNRPTSSSREEMHRIRVDFTKAMGLDWSQNPNPNSGYKHEHNLSQRQQYLDEAVRLRDQYADMVQQTGRGRDILEKMERNLENRDRKTTWK